MLTHARHDLLLEPLAGHVQSLPNPSELISGKAQISDLCDVDESDLLGRDLRQAMARRLIIF
jgi:FlaA1/EpsC-like NDP-sugar epimerase